jgi:hypothetical protein
MSDHQGGEAQNAAAINSEIRVETFAEAIVSALERRCLNGPLPPFVRQKFIAGLQRRNPDLCLVAPAAEARAYGEEHADQVVAYLKRAQSEM